MTIGDRLREERERLKLTQTALAEAAGTTKKTQIDYEKNKTPPNAIYLSVAASFGVDVSYVITGQRLENTAATPIELAVLRLVRALPSADAQKAGLAALQGVLGAYGVKLDGEGGEQ